MLRLRASFSIGFTGYSMLPPVQFNHHPRASAGEVVTQFRWKLADELVIRQLAARDETKGASQIRRVPPELRASSSVASPARSYSLTQRGSLYGSPGGEPATQLPKGRAKFGGHVNA